MVLSNLCEINFTQKSPQIYVKSILHKGTIPKIYVKSIPPSKVDPNLREINFHQLFPQRFPQIYVK